MRALLICPSERAGLARIFPGRSLSTLPLLGQTLIEYWIPHLVALGFKHLLLLVHERPSDVLALTGSGARWGIQVEVVPESRELSPAQALLKYGEDLETNIIANHIFIVDHFPGRAELPLFEDFRGFFEALQAWFPQALSADRAGYREMEPGIFVGRRASITQGAVLRAPCWIGAHASIQRGAIIGPYSIIEDGSVVESPASIEASYIGPDTFVGRFTEVKESLVWGNRLANWRTGSVVTVPDAFLLSALRKPAQPGKEGWMTRAADLCSRRSEGLLVWKQVAIKKEG